jgi:hypothetical protein
MIAFYRVLPVQFKAELRAAPRHESILAGVYWEWSKKKRKFVILCGVTGTILYYPRPPQ